MAIFRYLQVVFFGAFGALAVLRVLERLVFERGADLGSILVQAALGAGALMLAKRALDKARARSRPAPSEDSSPS
ncbi:hypothetical protein [Myxococcus stipitatus]|uniref:hypothetical protein n=1 Tax=Myxococcus stipitatus TaxID=83455 RepID=UPI0030CA677A